MPSETAFRTTNTSVTVNDVTRDVNRLTPETQKTCVTMLSVNGTQKDGIDTVGRKSSHSTALVKSQCKIDRADVTSGYLCGYGVRIGGVAGMKYSDDMTGVVAVMKDLALSSTLGLAFAMANWFMRSPPTRENIGRPRKCR